MDTEREIRYGGWYLRAIGFTNKLFGITPELIEAKARQSEERFEAEKRRIMDLLRKESEALAGLKEGGKEYTKHMRRIKALEREMEAKERAILKPNFNEAVEFTGLGVSEHEVVYAASFYSFLLFLSLLILTVGLYIAFTIPMMDIIMFFFIPNFCATLALFTFLANYPEILAKRLIVKLVGRSPEAVTYMCVSMRLTHSLNRSVTFAANNVGEPLASGLRKILWDVYLKRFNSIEESFLNFANRVGEWNDDLKRALYFIRVSTLESTREGLMQVLDKAHNTIIEGTKAKVSKYTTSLHTPSMVFFAMGIMLPLVIGAMLPMLSIKPMSLGTVTAEGVGMEGAGGGGGGEVDPIPIIFIMDVLFPSIALIYAYNILGKRPAVTPPPRIEGTYPRTYRLKVLFALFVASALTFALAFLPIGGEMHHAILALPPLWAVTIVISGYSLATSRREKALRNRIHKLEREFPDALYQLGSRIAEGIPIERALKITAKNLKGSEISELFNQIAYNLHVTKKSLRDVLFGHGGVLSELPSDTIKGYMKMVVEVENKDPMVAGELIMSSASYLRDLKNTEEEMKTGLSRVMEVMTSTAVMFAPIILGITSALYLMLSGITVETGLGVGMMPPYMFFLVLGVYMIAFLIIVMYFATGIESGEDDYTLLKYRVGTSMPVAMAVFSVALIFSNLMIS